MKSVLFFLFITIIISVATVFIGKFFAIPIFYYIHYILWLITLFIFFVLLGDFKINKFLDTEFLDTNDTPAVTPAVTPTGTPVVPPTVTPSERK
tara:strand:- start:330 stop:611 length:282 start_codon:yes stop_codon:yes gene_type:complete